MKEQLEYLILSCATIRAIQKAVPNAKLADIKHAALQLKREGAITDEEAGKYFSSSIDDVTEKKPRVKKVTETPAKKRGRRPNKVATEEKPGRRPRRNKVVDATE